MEEFIDNLHAVMVRHKLGPADIWNMGEAGVTTVPVKILVNLGQDFSKNARCSKRKL